MPPPMRVVIAGSRRLPPGQAPRLLIRFLAGLPDNAIIMLRTGIRETGRFEQDVENLCAMLSLMWQWWVPEPSEETPGRASVYRRDIEMIEHADLVILFFAADEVAEGYGGTQHLLDKAFDANRPVYAYSVDESGVIDRIGEYDPDHLYADAVPSA